MKKITGKSNQNDLIDYVFDMGNVQAEHHREVIKLRTDLTKAERKIDKLSQLLSKNHTDNLLKFSDLYDKINVLEGNFINTRKVRNESNLLIN